MTGNFQLQSLESRTMFSAAADTLVQPDAASLQQESVIQMSKQRPDFGNTTLDSSNGNRGSQFTGNSVEAKRNDTPVS